MKSIYLSNHHRTVFPPGKLSAIAATTTDPPLNTCTRYPILPGSQWAAYCYGLAVNHIKTKTYTVQQAIQVALINPSLYPGLAYVNQFQEVNCPNIPNLLLPLHVLPLLLLSVSLSVCLSPLLYISISVCVSVFFSLFLSLSFFLSLLHSLSLSLSLDVAV